jgi:hypothetical protein
VSDPVDDILRLVAEGRLTAEEAEPILAALDEAEQVQNASPMPPAGQRPDPAPSSQSGRTIRVEVTDDGRVALNLRLPASLGELGLDGIPGLSRASLDRIAAAVRAGTQGPVFEAVDDHGDGVRIVVE